MWNETNIEHGTIILTSLYKDYIKIVISGSSTIVIDHLPEKLLCCEILIELHNTNGISVYKEVIKSSLPYDFQLPYLPSGCYSLHIFYKLKNKSNSYVGLNTVYGFPLEVKFGTIYTIIPRTLCNNKSIFLDLNNRFTRECVKNNISNKYFVPSEIIDISHEITKYSYSNYDKILAIHDWVASNIYYDYDSIADNSYIKQKQDALSVVRRKRTVCTGYSELAVTLLRALGIAALNVDCFTLNEQTKENWVKSDIEVEANHVITFAYADDRWIMMDVTWDSDNEYKNACYRKKNEDGVSHQYFDCTLAFISYTHKFIK